VEDLSEVKRRLHIVVPQARVAQEVDQAYRDLAKRVKVKGFRPGKIPRSVLQLYYRKQVEQEVSDTLVRRSLGEALKEKSLEAVGLNWPESLPPVVTGADFLFSVEVEVPPQFTVENYRGLTLEDPGVPVREEMEEMVDARVEEIRQSNAMLQPLTEPRGLEEGDFAILSYQAYFAGQPVAEGKAEQTYLEVGTGKFNLDFERQLLGLTPGAESRSVVNLPSDFFNPLLAGKVVEFQVTLHDVKTKVVPELDDALAQSLGGNFQSLADLREAVREDIIKDKERERQRRLEQQALDQLLAAHSFEVPPSLIRQEQDNIVREQLERMEQHGLNLAGMDVEKMLETYRPLAERRVRVGLLLERLASQENLTVDDAELAAELQQRSDQSGRPLEEIRKIYEERNLLGLLRRQLRDEKVVKFILAQATLVASATEAAKEQESE